MGFSARVDIIKTLVSCFGRPDDAKIRQFRTLTARTMHPILLVDDELHVRRLIQIVLLREGFQVVEAEDGLDALSALRELKGECSLIISDVIMPRMDGITLCRQVRKEFSWIPILLISGNEPEACRVADRYLGKPLHPTVLVTAVRELLGTAHHCPT
jgi:CheY-like chemotaxis protein